MKHLRLQISVLFFVLLTLNSVAQNKYGLFIRGVDKEASAFVTQLGLQTQFPTRIACIAYVDKLPALLQSKGFVSSSLDSVNYGGDSARIVLFLGEQYRWAVLDTRSIDPSLLDAIAWRGNQLVEKPIDFTKVQLWQDRLLNQLENTGYPFAKVYLDSFQLKDDKAYASLKINRGPLYKIDSIRVYGNAKISGGYLQRYLGIPNGSIYNKEKLKQVNKKMRELTYIEEEKPFDITYLGTGSVLNMYLKQKRSSQVNVLIGILPNSDQLSSKKLLITGEANILLKNALGAGETIGLNWQQLQQKSPRLNLLYQHPYLFKSPIGLDFTFDMYRKDSSFLNINFQLGAQYSLNNSQAGKLFIQRFQTIVSLGGFDTNRIIQSKVLPEVADVSSFNIGLEYEWNTTDYRLNPRKGNDFRITTAIGTKELKKNDQILQLKDPNDPSYDFDHLYDGQKLKTYQLRVRMMAAHYFPFASKRSTVKTMLNTGVFQSGNVFRNELFQLGGYKLLRGFDEESQYLSHYAIGTVEYRLLLDQNSYFYVLADGGWGRNNSPAVKQNYTYFGTGMGIAFETKAGIFNLAWAVGKRNDTDLNLRRSKIHIGFVSYF